MRAFWKLECVWLVVFQLVVGNLSVGGWWQGSSLLGANIGEIDAQEIVNIEKQKADDVVTQIISGEEVGMTDVVVLTAVTSESEIQKAFEEALKAPDTLFPEGTRVDEICLDEGDLLIGFSEEFMNYGGTMWEEELVRCILDTAFSFHGVEKVTVHVAEKLQIFVEGSCINGYTREKWEERKDNGDDEIGW